MIKDKQWLKEALFELRNKGNPENNQTETEKEIELGRARQWAWNNCVDRAYELVEQLDEPEANCQIDKLAKFIMSEVEGEPSQSQGAVDAAIRIIKSYQNQETLSQDWINKYSYAVAYDGMPDDTEIVYVDDLQNLLVPEQELPVIPDYVEERIEKSKENKLELGEVFSGVFTSLNLATNPTEDLFWIRDNQELFARAWLDGFAVEEEQKYYARIKGWELFADFVGAKYWGAVSSYGRLGIGSVDDAISMTKDEWNELGINDKNADFVPVEENE